MCRPSPAVVVGSAKVKRLDLVNRDDRRGMILLQYLKRFLL